MAGSDCIECEMFAFSYLTVPLLSMSHVVAVLPICRICVLTTGSEVRCKTWNSVSRSLADCYSFYHTTLGRFLACI